MAHFQTFFFPDPGTPRDTPWHGKAASYVSGDTPWHAVTRGSHFQKRTTSQFFSIFNWICGTIWLYRHLTIYATGAALSSPSPLGRLKIITIEIHVENSISDIRAWPACREGKRKPAIKMPFGIWGSEFRIPNLIACHHVSLRVTACHRVSWHVTACHSVSRRVTACHGVSRRVTAYHGVWFISEIVPYIYIHVATSVNQANSTPIPAWTKIIRAVGPVNEPPQSSRGQLGLRVPGIPKPARMFSPFFVLE